MTGSTRALPGKALEAAGADTIQFDEPAFNVYLEEVRDWGVAALGRAAAGLKCTTAVHICYGYGIKANDDWFRESEAAAIRDAAARTNAFAFGAQSLVKDVIAGFFYLVEGQFAIGDIVSQYEALYRSVM